MPVLPSSPVTLGELKKELRLVVPSDGGNGEAPRPPSSTCEISVVLPCLNEEETLGACIEEAQQCMEEYAIDGEVVVADNGSTDDSLSIARRHGARVVHVEEKGYGSALMGGIEAAGGKYVLMADADCSYDLSAIPLFLKKLREGYDMVMGNRFRGGIEPGAMPLLHRYLGNPVLSKVGRSFYDSPVNDFHCGLRAFDREAVLALGLRMPGMEFASEMVVRATLDELRIAEVPTTLRPDGRSGEPHLSTWRDGWRHLRFLLLHNPKRLFLYPGLVLMGVGLTALAWLLPGAQTVGSVTLDVHTMLYAAMLVIVGFQGVAFSLLAKASATSKNIFPKTPLLSKLLRYTTLERGLATGGVLLSAGLASFAFAFTGWGMNTFGPIDPSVFLRYVIPSVLTTVLGFEVLLASFFLSVVRLPARR